MDTNRSTLSLLGTTAALYVAFSVLPALGLLAAAAYWGWQRFSLAPNEHFTPAVDGLWIPVLVGVLLTGLVSLIPSFVLGIRRLPHNIRLGTGIALVTVHAFLVVGTVTATGSVSVLPQVFDREHLRSRVPDPNSARSALLYEDKGECTWNLYVSEPMDPVAKLAKHQTCACGSMRQAEARWINNRPELVDPSGQPFSCPAPPRACATSPLHTAPLLVLLAALGLRRRRATAPCPAA